VLLLREVVRQRVHDILVQHIALRAQRVDPFFINFPRYSVDQKRVLDGVVLTQHRIIFEFLRIQDLHIGIDQQIQLSNTIYIEVLMNEEKFYLMIFNGVS
jgi:hypothetical protein